MYLFWIFWGIDAFVASILVYFFFVGLGDGSISSDNIVLWLVILLGLAAVLLGSYWLFVHQYTIAAKLLLSLVAVPGLLYALFMGLVLFGGNSSGWKWVEIEMGAPDYLIDIQLGSETMAMTLSEIKKQVETLGELIDVPQNLYPTYGHSADGALPHVEVDDSGHFHFVVVERGQELERRTTMLLDELLFWIFDTMTFSIACAFELKNRNSAEDFRRILFSKQEELLGIINRNWQEKERGNHTLILAKHPFTDVRL
jgi:hypothetical protein